MIVLVIELTTTPSPQLPIKLIALESCSDVIKEISRFFTLYQKV